MMLLLVTVQQLWLALARGSVSEEGVGWGGVGGGGLRHGDGITTTVPLHSLRLSKKSYLAHKFHRSYSCRQCRGGQPTNMVIT
jgi:hypothetical protein